jgi:hypothetical protein
MNAQTTSTPEAPAHISFVPPDSNAVVEWALAYARSGMAVFPVGSHKRPVISKANGGAGYKDATLDEAQIRAWFEGQWRHADIGWAVPPRLVVADLDCKGGKRGLHDFARLEGVEPDDVMTPIAVTPSGGRHLVYAAKGNEYANEVEIPGTGIDLRTAGGYIVLPTADNGRQWHRPLTTPIAGAPGWLPLKGATKPRSDGAHESSGWTLAPEDLLNHARLTAIGMKLLVSGMNPGAAVNLLRAQVEALVVADEERRQRRLTEIPAIIASAERKVRGGQAPEGELLDITFEDAPVEDDDAMEAKVATWKAMGVPDDQIEWSKNAALGFERLPVEERRAFEAMTRAYVRARLANGGEHPPLTEELGRSYRENFLKIDLFNLIDVPPDGGPSCEAASPLGGITVGKGADWTNVDGVLGEMRDWILATSPYPNRRMAVMAAFAALSGTTARHLYTPTGLGLGLVMAMLARTTVGKDAPLSAVAKILYAAGLGHMSQPAKSFTVSGFEQSLIDSNGACVATGDEIGENLLARILSKKAMPHETMMKTFIMEATGQQDSSPPFALTKRGRNGSKDLAPIQALNGILFTMLGASTPGKFFETLSNGNVSDGLLGRVLTINADPKPEESEAPFIHVPDGVVAALRAITEIGDTGELNLDGLPGYERKRARWTPEGSARYRLLGKQIDALLATEPPYEELYGRAKANALVLATLLAISRDHAAPVVDASDIDQGAAMVMESIAATIAGLGDATGGTDYGRMVRDIEVYVRKRKAATVREIGNAVRGYSKKERMAALTDMEELGKVTIRRYKDSNGVLSILPNSAVAWSA